MTRVYEALRRKAAEEESQNVVESRVTATSEIPAFEFGGEADIACAAFVPHAASGTLSLRESLA